MLPFEFNKPSDQTYIFFLPLHFIKLTWNDFVDLI